MFNRNENGSRPSNSLSPTIEQEYLQGTMPRKLNELQDQISIQLEQNEKLPLDYETLSDDHIEERLLRTMENDIYLQNKIKAWLKTNRTLLLFIRQHACLLGQYVSLKMELELYHSYMNMTHSALDWLSGMSKPLINRFNINNNVFKIQKYIKTQLKNFQEKFNAIKEKLAKSILDQQHISTLSSEIDIRLITSLILRFVRQDQTQLNIELIMKRHLLMLEIKDVRLVHEFFHLQPTLRQLQIAEFVWQATINEQEQEDSFNTQDYAQIIEDQKKLFLPADKNRERGKDSLPNKYSQLNTDLLLNIIESRQKTLIQRLAFNSDFNNRFLLDHDGDIDTNQNVKADSDSLAMETLTT